MAFDCSMFLDITQFLSTTPLSKEFHDKSDQTKLFMKYSIFMCAFIFEDLGQVLCQEILVTFWKLDFEKMCT